MEVLAGVLGPQHLPQSHGVAVTELSLEPDEKPAEAEIQIPRFLKILFESNWKPLGKLTSLVNEVTLKKNYAHLTSLKIDLGIEVAVEGRVDKLQDVTQFLKLPLHPSLHKVFITTQVSARS